MFDEHVELFERVVIEEEFDALARGQLALGVLLGYALLAPAETGALGGGVEAGEHLFHQWLRSLKLLSAQLSTTSRSLEWGCLCAQRLALRRAALVPRSVPCALPTLAAGLEDVRPHRPTAGRGGSFGQARLAAKAGRSRNLWAIRPADSSFRTANPSTAASRRSCGPSVRKAYGARDGTRASQSATRTGQSASARWRG